MDRLLESLTAACQGKGCGSCHQVGWCPAWDMWLCAECRWRRNESELRVTLAARQALMEAQEAVPGG